MLKQNRKQKRRQGLLELELAAESEAGDHDIGSPSESSITVKGSMHWQMISSGEWPGMRGPGCTTLGGAQEQDSSALLKSKAVGKKLLEPFK